VSLSLTDASLSQGDSPFPSKDALLNVNDARLRLNDALLNVNVARLRGNVSAMTDPRPLLHVHHMQLSSDHEHDDPDTSRA
jgi:hypothetical protein